jgi:NADH dehydrogenase FAD-containing subunit
MAMRYAGAEVTLFAEANAFSDSLGRRVTAALRRARVDYRPGMRVDSISKGPLVFSGSARQEFDRVVLATGAAPLAFFARSGLALDDKGFVRVDENMRSVSHPEVFAVGDCAALAEAKSGVHAVRQGAVLERNLRHFVKDESLEPYHPTRRALLILTCGARYAIAARGSLSVEGRWVWWWKNSIDRRWLKRLNGLMMRRPLEADRQ